LQVNVEQLRIVLEDLEGQRLNLIAIQSDPLQFYQMVECVDLYRFNFISRKPEVLETIKIFGEKAILNGNER
jgi:hypothetical protein